VRYLANVKHKERARELRKGRNLAEALMWKELKEKQLNGLSFDRQSLIGHYIADFYCASAKVVIEIDGSSHIGREEYDHERDEFMKAIGLTVIRISDADVKFNMTGVLSMLANHPALRKPRPCTNNRIGNSPLL